MIKECVPLTGITAVCKEMFCFRSQLQMVKSCFCLCLNSTLGFHILCFPFHIWLFACCLCSPNVFRCAEVAFLPYRLLPELFCSDQCMATAVSRWCSTAATTSNLIKQGSPYQSRGYCKGLCWQCTTTAIETLMSHWAVSSPSVPIPAVQGDGKPWGLSRHSGRLTVGGVFLPQERRLRGC